MGPLTTWLASYPKSGNTWLRVLLDNWFSGAGAPADINRLRGQAWSPNDPERFEAATLLAPDGLLPAEIEALRGPAMGLMAGDLSEPAIVKIHNAYTPAYGATVARAAIYVVRDPRDVAPSLASHLGIPIDGAIDRLNAMAMTMSASVGRGQRQLPQPLSDWSGHVRGWLEDCELPTLLVRYEDLPGAFTRVLAFLGEPEDAGRLERTVWHSRLEELQQQERTRGFRERGGDAPFFRAGRAGAWREALTAAQAARIEQAHGEQMRRLGYL